MNKRMTYRDVLEQETAREQAGLISEWAREIVRRYMKADPELDRIVDMAVAEIWVRTAEKMKRDILQKYGKNSNSRRKARRSRG